MLQILPLEKFITLIVPLNVLRTSSSKSSKEEAQEDEKEALNDTEDDDAEMTVCSPFIHVQH